MNEKQLNEIIQLLEPLTIFMILVALTFMAIAYTYRNTRMQYDMMLIANFIGITALILLAILLTVSAL